MNQTRVLKALVVCHAGEGLGLGHLTRALVVARALQKEIGAQVKLLIQGDVVLIEANDRFEHPKYQILFRGWDLNYTYQWLWQGR